MQAETEIILVVILMLVTVFARLVLGQPPTPKR
jgi:hypothetical protein